MTRLCAEFLLITASVALLAVDAVAQGVPIVTPLLGNDTGSSDRFGKHATLGDSVTVIGALSRERVPGSPYGGAYVFRRTDTGSMGGWNQEAILTTPYTSGQTVGHAVGYARLGGVDNG